MNYSEARQFIERLAPRGIEPGLKTITRLCALAGDPQLDIKTVHIAGTNGKGSTGAFIESILMSAGYSVCRFSSPAVGGHLEMFTFNGKPVSEEDYSDCITNLLPSIKQLEAEGFFPTSFEAETAAAFMMFSKLAPDYSIIECGMGGRLDCTNVLGSPAVSVITSISLDHTAFLGGSISEIAREKAGIIKHGCPVVTVSQPAAAAKLIADTCETMSAPLRTAEDIRNTVFSEDLTTFDLEDMHSLKIKLKGTFQPQNAAAAAKACMLLGIDESAIRRGLLSAQWGYRFERIGRYILDGAHNPAAARELVRSIDTYLKGHTVFICGVFRDKDHKTIAAVTSRCADCVYTVKPPGKRGLESSVLCDEFRKSGAVAYAKESLEAAFRSASGSGCDNILIFGSLSILREAKQIIMNSEGK